MTIQITVPYEILRERHDEIIRWRIRPEIYLNSWVMDTCRDDDMQHLCKTLREAGISYTLHAPYMDLAPGGVDSKIRKVTRERFEHVLHLTSLVKPQVVVFHTGYDRRRYGELQDLWFQGSLEMWRPLVNEAEKLGVTLVLENVFEEEPETIERLLDAINSPHCGFCFDTGHWLVYGRQGWKQWITGLSKRIVEVHIHDNNGREDQHLPPGDGGFDFPGFFRFMWEQGLSPIYTLEIHREEELLRGIETVRRYLEGQGKG